MPKYYIAYSIHGSNAFIVATKEFEGPLPEGFTEVTSRLPVAYRKEGIKLHWQGLLTQKQLPCRSPAMILHRFKQLEADGWTILKDAFLDKHYSGRNNHE